MYEVSPVEPLHALKGHIMNLYEEIPPHLSSEERIIFEKTLNYSFAGKQSKLGYD